MLVVFRGHECSLIVEADGRAVVLGESFSLELRRNYVAAMKHMPNPRERIRYSGISKEGFCDECVQLRYV